MVRCIAVKRSVFQCGLPPIPSLSYRLNVQAHKTPPHACIPTNTLLATREDWCGMIGHVTFRPASAQFSFNSMLHYVLRYGIYCFVHFHYSALPHVTSRYPTFPDVTLPHPVALGLLLHVTQRYPTFPYVCRRYPILLHVTLGLLPHATPRYPTFTDDTTP